jgi:hypothetical protein
VRQRLVPMRRLLVAVALAVATYGAGTLTPTSVVACSCLGNLSMEEHVKMAPEAALVVGQVMRDRGDGSFDFAVARWYGGQDRRAVVVLQSAKQGAGENVSYNTCGMDFRLGQHLLFLGGPLPNGRYEPGICGLSADPSTPVGADYERLAATLIGPPIDPQPEPAEPPPAATASGGPDLLLVGAGIGGAVLLLFGVVIVAGRRTRRGSS